MLGIALPALCSLALCSFGGPAEVSGDIRPVAAAAPPANAVGVLYKALLRCRSSLPEMDRWRIAGVIQDESRRYGYDPLFVLAMVEVESTCSPTALGQHGAVGLIQIKPSTAKAVAEEAGVRWRGTRMLTRPTFNVALALRYLWKLERRFQDPYLAMVAYNRGPERVAGMSRRSAHRAAYVRKILARYEDLLARYSMSRA
jgi:soluble lytic murein transglycosylase-like protein